MPAMPRAHLILVHTHFALAAFETRLNAGARLDHPREFPKRRLLECHPASIARREVIMIAVVGVVIGSITRGAWLQRAIVRQRTTGDHQPLCGSGAFALHPRLHPACDHLDGYWAFLTISHYQSPPGTGSEQLVPRRDRLPGGLWTTTTPWILGWQSFEVTNGGGAGHPEHIVLAALTQFLAKPC